MTPATDPASVAPAHAPSASAVPGAKVWLRSPALWLLVVVFAAEFFLFDQYGVRRHTAIYPRWNDQIQYLTESYTGHELARTRGLIAALSNALTNPSAQGTLHDFFAIIVFAIAGPSRSAALSLNIFALIAWQLALFAAAARAQPSRALAFAIALLPALLKGPWENAPGSAFDFRLDHLAMCAIGVCASLAWLSDGFRSKRGSTWFGVAVGLTLTTRFLTGTYFALIFLGLLGWAMSTPERNRRALNLVRAGLAAFLIAAPFLWLNYESVREYYWIGHFIGPESVIRNAHLSFGSSLTFVGGTLVQRHLGLFLLCTAGIAAAILICLRQREAPAPSDRAAWWIGAVFLLSPALVLTLHQQKSEVVVSALVPGALVLIAALWIATARRASAPNLRVVVAVVTAAALAWFVRGQVPPAFRPEVVAEAKVVNALADEIYRRAKAGGLPELRIAVDYITDALDAQVLRVICYERQRVLVPVNMTLPTSIAEPDEATVMSRLEQSDFVFLTASGADGPFPYDRKLTALRPQLRAWCDTHLRVANEFTLFGRRMILYQRKEIPFP
jgi:hypothetical protein